jgi:ribonuclease P protein component
MKNFGIKKSERLKSRKTIETIFSGGSSSFAYPIKAVYKLIDDAKIESNLEFGVSVPKKKFKRAVDRNLIKRRIREAYRLNATPIKNVLSEGTKSYAVMFIYVGKEIESFDKIQKAMIKIIADMPSNL